MNNQQETDKDPVWDKLSANWQSGDSENLLEHAVPDDAVLIAKVKKSMKFDAIIILFAAIFTSWQTLPPIINEISEGLPSVYDVVFFYGMLVIILLTIASMLWFAKASLKTQVDSTQTFIELSLKKVNISLNSCRAGQLCCIAILLLFFGIVTWLFVVWLAAPHPIAKPIMAAKIAAFFSLFFPAMLYFLHREKAKLTVQKQFLINLQNGLS